jgi:hypothetical protein
MPFIYIFSLVFHLFLMKSPPQLTTTRRPQMTTYTNAIHGIDPMAALTLLGLEGKQEGSYIYYPCPECGGRAVVKAWGEKKNLTFCTKCKKAGNIIGLAMKLSDRDYSKAVELLNRVVVKRKELTEELSLNYELDYCDFLKENGITEETAQKYGIGKPKGKTMLSGCIAFPVIHKGKKIAYCGLRIKDGKVIAHNTFNKELYIFGLDDEKEITLTPSLIECIQLKQEGRPAVSNFGLPYLSPEQSILLEEKFVILKIPPEYKKEFSILSADFKFFHKFE